MAGGAQYISQIQGRSIYATASLSASSAVTASYALTAETLLGTILSASYALTASHVIGGGGGGGTPGGSSTQIQYNNGGAFEGVPTLTYNGTILRATGSFTGSFAGNLTGTASNATNAFATETITVQRNTTDATYFLTFVDSNNSTPQKESVYTGAGILVNPAARSLTIQSAVTGGVFLGPLTGSVFGTSSWAARATTASSVDTLNQTVTINGNLNVFGTASFVFVTASQLAVSQSYISVNVFEPQQRFGGLYVYDSGSSNATASLSWDSLLNRWIYSNASGSTYMGGMLLSGPRNTGSLGSEPSLTRWFVSRGDGGDHLNDTQIFSSASIHVATGSLLVTDTIATSGSILVNTTNQTMGQFVGNTDGYVEFSIRNTSTGISASGDIAVYADNGTVLNNYIDIGINNSNLTGSYFYGGTDFGNALDAYVYNVGGNLRIGNATSQAPFSQSLYLFSNPAATVDLAITGSKVGIGGITAPQYTLDVNGSLRATGTTILSGLTTTNQNNVVTVDTATGQLYYTASSAFGGGGGAAATGTDYGIVYAASLGYFMP